VPWYRNYNIVVNIIVIDNQRRNYVYYYILHKGLETQYIFYLKRTEVIQIIYIIYKSSNEFTT